MFTFSEHSDYRKEIAGSLLWEQLKKRNSESTKVFVIHLFFVSFSSGILSTLIEREVFDTFANVVEKASSIGLLIYRLVLHHQIEPGLNFVLSTNQKTR